MAFSIIKVEREDRPIYQEGLRRLEKEIRYPLGSDFFYIDHGDDYFRFFDRLGELSFYIGLNEDKVVACAGASLRTLPQSDGSLITTWYLCDLKVSPHFRGEGFLDQVLNLALADCYEVCPKAYAISMNEPGSKGSRITRWIKRKTKMPFEEGPALLFFNLEEKDMIQSQEIVEKALGPISFLDVSNEKDILVGPEGHSMALLHVQHGRKENLGLRNPKQGSLHMLCLPEKDPLALELISMGHGVSAEATVLQLSIQNVNWRQILTNEI